MSGRILTIIELLKSIQFLFFFFSILSVQMYYTAFPIHGWMLWGWGKWGNGERSFVGRIGCKIEYKWGEG